MGLSWTKIGLRFKSPLRVVVQFLWRSRENKAQKCRDLKQQLDEARGMIAKQEAEIQRQAEEIRQLEQQTRRLEYERHRLAATQVSLPADPRLKGHKFGRRMIRLAVNLRGSSAFVPPSAF